MKPARELLKSGRVSEAKIGAALLSELYVVKARRIISKYGQMESALLARERYSDYREAPPQCRGMAGDEACARVAQKRPRLRG